MGITDPTGTVNNICKGTQLHQELRLENVGCLRSFIHSFILFPIHLTMTSEGLIGTKDLCLLLGTQCGGKMHTILVYMELLVQKAKAVGCSAKLGLWIFKNGSRMIRSVWWKDMLIIMMRRREIGVPSLNMLVFFHFWLFYSSGKYFLIDS